MMRDPVTVLIVLVLVSLSGVIGSCSVTPEPPKNLILITIDTLRPDRLGFSGSDRDTSPAIDRLASEGVRFRSAYSQAGWTLPSIATILTGHYPTRHGAIEVNHSIDSDLSTLASFLKTAGYQTSAFVSHVMLSPKHGFSEGFDIYDDSVLDVGHPHKVSTAGILTDRVLEALPSSESPFFLWVHYFDPHFDYMPHAEWSTWGSTDIDLYDGEIAFTDRQIGRLLDELTKAGLMRNTLTIMTGDHGEAFGERGTRHHFSMYEEVIRVPLLIHGPSIRSRDIDSLAQQVDLMPTILTALNLESPADLPGRDLLSGDGDSQDLFVERYRPQPFVQQAVIRGTDKLVRIGVPAEARDAPDRLERAFKRTKVRPGIYLFDLEDDPNELNNLYTPDDPKAIELLETLSKHFAESADSVGDVAIDDETRERLEALGYLN